MHRVHCGSGVKTSSVCRAEACYWLKPAVVSHSQTTCSRLWLYLHNCNWLQLALLIMQPSPRGSLETSFFSVLYKKGWALSSDKRGRDRQRHRQTQRRARPPWKDDSEQNHSTLHESSSNWQRFILLQLYWLIRVSQFSCLKYKEMTMEAMWKALM